MSIKIDIKNCIGCGKCIDVCPGNLLYKDEKGKAYIKYPSQCWGCASCLKECNNDAIKYFLGIDIGGRGTTLSVKKDGFNLYWVFEKPNGERITIKTNQKESNNY